MTSLDKSAPGPTSAEAAAYSWLKERIRRGHLQPGHRLRAEEIADAVGVSRMPVREALRRLDSEGLVTLRLNRGAVVTRYSDAELVELFEIRAVLEGLGARRAVHLLDAAHFAELERLIAEMTRSESQGDLWMERHWEFHRLLLRLSGARKLERDVERLFILLEPYLRVWLASDAKTITPAEEHHALLDDLRRGDADRAEAAMRAHVLTTAPMVVDQLIALRG